MNDIIKKDIFLVNEIIDMWKKPIIERNDKLKLLGLLSILNRYHACLMYQINHYDHTLVIGVFINSIGRENHDIRSLLKATRYTLGKMKNRWHKLNKEL